MDRSFTPDLRRRCRKSRLSLVRTTGGTQTAYCMGTVIRRMVKGQQSWSVGSTGGAAGPAGSNTGMTAEPLAEGLERTPATLKREVLAVSSYIVYNKSIPCQSLKHCGKARSW